MSDRIVTPERLRTIAGEWLSGNAQADVNAAADALEDCAALREALVYIRAEIRDFGVQDADDAWYEAIEKVDAWLAQSQPDGVKHE